MARKVKGQTASGKVRIRVYDYMDSDGKQHYKSFTAPTKKEAQAMANEWKASKSIDKKRMSVEDAVKGYVDINKERLSPSTHKSYLACYRRIQKYPIAKVDLFSMTNADVQAMVNKLHADELSSKTITNTYLVLKPAVEMYRDDFRFKVTLFPKDSVEKRIPTMDDVKAVFSACNCPEMKLAIIFAIAGMARVGEICAIEYADVDRKNRTITINKAFSDSDDSGFVIKKPKTAKSVRTIYNIDDATLSLIEATGRSEGYIMGFSPQSLEKRMRRTVERSGVEHFTMHCLRHLGNSIADSANIPDTYIEDLGGWERGSKVRKKNYTHAIDSEKDKYNRQYYDLVSEAWN